MRMAKALWVSIATMASRVLGLIRDQLFVALIGANRYSDAFVVAFRIPNLLRDLLAEGSLSAAFIPTFADYERNKGIEAAYRLANSLIALILIIVGAIVIIGIALAYPLVAVLAPGFSASQSDLAAHLTRIMMPFLLLVSLSAIVMGMLNAQSRFTAPALAPAFFNVGAIVVGIGLWFYQASPLTTVTGWALGALLGGLLQLSVQLPALWRAGFRVSIKLSRSIFAEPGLRRIGSLMAAALIGLSATQINILVNTIFASHVESANTYLQIAFRLMQLPLGVFGVAIATVAGAGVAQQVAAKDIEGVRRTLGSAMRMVAFLNIPSALGLIVLANPIIALIFEHGRFSAVDTAGTASALVFYALGLYGYSAVKVFAPAFYAMGAARVPVFGSILGMITNVSLNIILFPILSYRGVALGTACAATINFLVLFFAWRRLFGGLATSQWGRQFAQILIAASLMAAAAYGTAQLLSPYMLAGIKGQLIKALVPIVVGGLIYFGVVRVLKIREFSEMLKVLRRRQKTK
ncbi:MAG: murein biosynthesis integral membrane protein MurJ [Deltaproteobacteria bacterium]|nr:murein biosynthesis integral membrane protein MurJ [Deltaproteobacteria bacterium]